MKLDQAAAILAFRARLQTLVVATTGAITLSANTDGYSRTSGSFEDDGFYEGMEITPSGFVDNEVAVITELTALRMVVDQTRLAETAASGRTIRVLVPVRQQLIDSLFRPELGKPWIQEQWVPGPRTRTTTSRRSGHANETGAAVYTWYGIEGKGLSTFRCVQAVIALFECGTEFSVGSNVVHITGNPGPYPGTPVPHKDGFSRCPATLPWEAHTQPIVAA